MTIVTAGDLYDLSGQSPFRANGSVVTLKKISETDWILLGDLAEGGSEGFTSDIPNWEPLVLTFDTDSIPSKSIKVHLAPIYPEMGGVVRVTQPGQEPYLESWVRSITIPHQQGNISYEIWGESQDQPFEVEIDSSYTPVFDMHVNSWGDVNIVKWTLETLSAPDTLPSSVKYLGGLCKIESDVTGWDVSNVETFATTFGRSVYRPPTTFNQDISGWDVSGATGMHGMFINNPHFNQDISGWDVSNVTSMTNMFNGCSSFNQDLSGWCVSNISSEPYNFSTGATSWTLPKPIWGTCPQRLAPGDEFEGGYFVGVSFDGNYNLFVSKGQIGSYKFSQSDYAPYTSADSETDGYYNTQQILNTSSSYAFPAAQACDEHFSDGFGGWFLPSRYELGLLFDNSSHIPLALPARVWTSEDRTDQRSLTFYFTGSFPGTTSATYKSNTYPVYAFRRVPR